MGDPGQRDVIWIENRVRGLANELLRVVAETVGDGGGCPEESALGAQVVEGDVAVDLEHSSPGRVWGCL